MHLPIVGGSRPGHLRRYARAARANGQEQAYSPGVQQAVDRFHHAMGQLQKETILHVLAMRQVLTPQQAEIFDDTVVKALTEDAT